MSKYLLFKCPMVNCCCLFHFKRVSRKLKKIVVFHDRGPAKKLSFWGISQFYLFLSQMSNYLLFKCPGGGFHHFQRLFGKSKKLKIFMTTALCKNYHFEGFTFLHTSISKPNEQIFTFQVSCGQLRWFSSFSKAFWKVKKIEDFHDHGPVQKL